MLALSRTGCGLLVVTIMLGACRSVDATKGTTVRMENGLTFSIPGAEKYSIENAPNGARIRPAKWRSTRELSEVIVEVKDSPPVGDFKLQKSVGGRHIKYRIDASD